MLEANIGDLVITGKGVFTVESINTTQTQEGTSTSISGHALSGYFRSVKHGEDAYEVISNPTPKQAFEVYSRERKLARLNESIGNYEKNRIISRYYSNNLDTQVTLTIANPKTAKEARAKMGKLEHELNSLREWVMERYLEYSIEFAAALEAHNNPYAPLEAGGEKVTIKKHEFQVGRVYGYKYRRPKRYLFFDNRTTYAKVYRVTKTRAYVELAGGKKVMHRYGDAPRRYLALELKSGKYNGLKTEATFISDNIAVITTLAGETPKGILTCLTITTPPAFTLIGNTFTIETIEAVEGGDDPHAATITFQAN